jgi:DNA repair protein RecO (recombination protein O)
MSSEKTEAIVIRQADFSETSRVVTFFTRDYGKISAIAKGARRLKGPFEAALDLLAVCRIVFVRKSSSSLDILTEAQLLSRFTPNGKNLASLYCGYYVAELLSSLSEEYDSHPVWYEEAVHTLNQLSESPNPLELILRFQLTTLREIGQLPDFDRCLKCDVPVTHDQSYVFWVSQGGLLCQTCRHKGYQQRQLQPGTIAVLNRLSDPSNSSWDRLILSPSQRQEIDHVVTTAICHALGRRPKLLRYLKDLPK